MLRQSSLLFNLNYEMLETRIAAAGIEFDSLYLPAGDSELRKAAKELSLLKRYSGSPNLKQKASNGTPK